MSVEETERLRAHAAKLWVAELYREYANVLFQFKLTLRPPLLRIEDLTSVWGSWQPLTRTIVLSRALIEQHSWDVVVEILKHEMAHQMATEVFGAGHYHDATFARACQLLGVADWAAKAGGALPAAIPQWRDRALSPEDERLLKRVEKLLALANSANEHEALLAMQKVQELYTKHRIERLRPLDGGADPTAAREAAIVHVVLTRRRKRMEAFESMIFSILGEHFLVRVIFGRQYDAQELTHFQVAELSGTQENVLMAEYVYHFLWQQIHALWRDLPRGPGQATGAAGKKSYLMGVLSGFRDKLGRLAKERGATWAADAAAAAGLSAQACRELVARADQQLETYVAQRHPRLTSKSWGGGCRDGGLFSAGVAAGERLTLRKGLGHSTGNRGLRLGPG